MSKVKTTTKPTELEPVLKLELLCEDRQEIANAINKMIFGFLPVYAPGRTIIGANGKDVGYNYQEFFCEHNNQRYEASVMVYTDPTKPIEFKLRPLTGHAVPDGLVSQVKGVFSDYEEVDKIAA